MTASNVLVELIAVGPGPGQTLRQQLTDGQTLRLGRSPQTGLSIPWDRSISREQADVCWRDDWLTVVCLPTAANSVRFKGETSRQIVAFSEDSFQIGQTTFRVELTVTTAWREQTMVAEPDPLVRLPKPDQLNIPQRIVPPPSAEVAEFYESDIDDQIEEHSYKVDDLKHVAFGDTERQMEVLSNLPRLIAGTQTDVDLALTLVGLLLQAIPTAVAVAVVVFDDDDLGTIRSTGELELMPKPKLMRVQTRDDFEGRFMPSRRLLRKALRQNESVMHIVGEMDAGDSGHFTMSGTLGWAFCSPITAESSVGWCLYVAGEGARDGSGLVTEEMLKGDLRFSQLVSQIIGSIRTVRTLQEHTTQLSSFFSPKVIANLTSKSRSSALTPSERDITVLFCDVRGFSRKSEALKNDLPKLLESVRAALSAMTGGILAFDGSIADFQGDAALGFWGWPESLPDGPISACSAALNIQQVFNMPLEEKGLLEGFACGVGIAHGRAIAGQIGTSQQAKIGVFGPVVNQGARIEGMTRMFGVGICIDEATAGFVQRFFSPTEGRVRRLARVRPKGMDTSLLISELVGADNGTHLTTAAVIQAYERALDEVIAGRWTQAILLLNEVPDSDGPKNFLLSQMAEFQNQPPADWDGAFRLTSKS